MRNIEKFIPDLVVKSSTGRQNAAYPNKISIFDYFGTPVRKIIKNKKF